MIIHAGKTQLNADAFRETTKEEFISAYAGKLNADIHSVWDQIQNKLGNLKKIENVGSNNKTSRSRKRIDPEQDNVGVEPKPTIDQSDY